MRIHADPDPQPCRVVSRFPRYISCYIAESHFYLWDSVACDEIFAQQACPTKFFFMGSETKI